MQRMHRELVARVPADHTWCTQSIAVAPVVHAHAYIILFEAWCRQALAHWWETPLCYKSSMGSTHATHASGVDANVVPLQPIQLMLYKDQVAPVVTILIGRGTPACSRQHSRYKVPHWSSSYAPACQAADEHAEQWCFASETLSLKTLAIALQGHALGDDIKNSQ
eukprot:1571088-Amphidinium_carterae.1